MEDNVPTCELSENSISAILSGHKIFNPRVQLLDWKEMSNSRKRHHRILINDGNNTWDVTICSGHLSQLINSGHITKYSIIQLDSYTYYQSRRIIYVKRITVLVQGAEVGIRIQKPTSLRHEFQRQVPTNQQEEIDWNQNKSFYQYEEEEQDIWNQELPGAENLGDAALNQLLIDAFDKFEVDD